MKDIQYGSGIIRVQTVEYQGKKYIDIRRFYLDKETNEYKPTKKGVSLHPDVAKEVLEVGLKELDNLFK